MSLMSRLKASLRLASSQLAGAHLTRFARDRFCSHFVSVMHGAGFRHLNSVADIRLRHVKVFLKNRLDAEASPRTICNQMSHLRNLLRVAGNVQISEQLNVSNRSLGIPQSTRLGSKVAINEIELAATLERVTCGACQRSCRLCHAAIGCLSMVFKCSVTTESRSGLSVTGPMGDQLRVWPDHRAGLRSRAFVYNAWRAARMA